MIISEVLIKMIESSDKNFHDINHFIKMHGLAKAIGELEGLTESEQMTLEIASIIHDIACPLCREKYGHTKGEYQEKEGMILAEKFLVFFEIPQEIKDRVVYLVGNHHTYDNIDGIDYQILLEADYLVNAFESDYSRSDVEKAMETVFKTKTGIELLKVMYL